MVVVSSGVLAVSQWRQYSTPRAIFNPTELYAGILGSQWLDRAARKFTPDCSYVKNYHLADYSSEFLDDRSIKAVEERGWLGDRGVRC